MNSETLHKVWLYDYFKKAEDIEILRETQEFIMFQEISSGDKYYLEWEHYMPVSFMRGRKFIPITLYKWSKNNICWIEVRQWLK